MNAGRNDWLLARSSRPADWRLRRAEHRLETGALADPRIDDGWVETALRLIGSPDLFEPGDPAVAAFDVWAGDRPCRQLLEAQLLTPRSVPEVAAMTGLPESVVEVYHRLFFDVRGRLPDRDWVLNYAVRSTPANSFAGPQPGGLWKYVAFTAGPLALDAVVAVEADGELPAAVTDSFVTNPALEEQLFRLRVGLVAAALTARTGRELDSLLRLRRKLRDLETATGLSAGGEALAPPCPVGFLAKMG